MSTAALLETHALTIETPGGRTLIRELSLRLGRERVAIVGRNGVGKSTLLEVLAGRQAPAGDASCAGAVVCWLPSTRGDSERPASRASPGERRRQLPGVGARRSSRPADARRADVGSGRRRHRLAVRAGAAVAGWLAGRLA